jgi:hypothetical protein
LALAAPAFATTTFISSGPLDGNDNAFFVTGPNNANIFGSVQDISDGFVSLASGTPTGGTFGLWVGHGILPTSFSLELGTTPFGTDLGSVSFSCSTVCGSFLFTNGFGFDVYSVNFGTSFFGALTAGQTYWLTLSNANDVSNSGTEAWDIPNGGLGTAGITCNFRQSGTNFGDCGVGGETFTLIGGSTVPEPSSLVLLGSGILGFAGVVRRKLSR